MTHKIEVLLDYAEKASLTVERQLETSKGVVKTKKLQGKLERWKNVIHTLTHYAAQNDAYQQELLNVAESIVETI